jgi:hypothetical protein
MKFPLLWLLVTNLVTFSLASPYPERPAKSPSTVPAPLPSYQNRQQSGLDRVGQLLTSPNHAWWNKVLPKRDNPSRTSVQKINKRGGDGSLCAVDTTIIYNLTTINLPTPTFCSYEPSSTDCSTGCICSPGCKSIYITNYTRLAAVNDRQPDASLGPNYHICTAWQLNYPAQISYAFQEAGFAILPGQPYQCGWQTWGSVVAQRVNRAGIDINGTLQYDQGDPAELAVIQSVLKAEYPFVEILVLCATLLGPIFMGVGLCFWTCAKPMNIEVKRSRGLYRRL